MIFTCIAPTTSTPSMSTRLADELNGNMMKVLNRGPYLDQAMHIMEAWPELQAHVDQFVKANTTPFHSEKRAYNQAYAELMAMNVNWPTLSVKCFQDILNVDLNPTNDPHHAATAVIIEYAIRHAQQYMDDAQYDAKNNPLCCIKGYELVLSNIQELMAEIADMVPNTIDENLYYKLYQAYFEKAYHSGYVWQIMLMHELCGGDRTITTLR